MFLCIFSGLLKLNPNEFLQFWLFIVLITDRLYQLYQLIIFIKLVFLSTQIGTPIGYSNRYPLFSIDHVATSLICNFFFLNRKSPYTFVLIFSNLFLFGLSFVVISFYNDGGPYFIETSPLI